jgi:hypothetical protein
MKRNGYTDTGMKPPTRGKIQNVTAQTASLNRKSSNRGSATSQNGKSTPDGTPQEMKEKPLARLAIIQETPGKDPTACLFGETDTIKATWLKWCAMWEDFERAGVRLTFKEVNPTLERINPDPAGRFRRENYDQHRGVTQTGLETQCDFGNEGRRSHIGFHKTKETAQRQYLRLWDIYGRRPGLHIWLTHANANHRPNNPNRQGFKNFPELSLENGFTQE